MADYTDLISRALSGDGAALGALYTETVATVYYSSLQITGAAYPAHLVTVRTYLLAFGNLGRLTHPAAFPVWLDRLSVYLAYHASRSRYSGAELSAAKARLIGFLRDFHRMDDAEIAALLTMEEQAVADCADAPEARDADEFLMGRDAVLGIWHDICSGTVTPLSDETDEPAAAQPEDDADDAAPAPDPADEQKSILDSAEYQRKRKRRRIVQLSAVAAALALIALTVYGAVHARSPEARRTKREVSRLASKLSLQLSGQVGEIYPLSEDTYFVSINLGYGSVEGLVIQYELAENAIRVSSPDGAELTERELQKLTGDRYMQVLYNPSGTGGGAVRAGATDAAPGETPLPSEATETPAPTKTPIRDGADEAPDAPEEEQHDFSIMLRINCRNVDFTRPVTVILDSAILKAIGQAGGLQIVLNDETHCVTLSTDQLNKLCSVYGSVTLRMTARSQRQYEISFYAENGKKVNELPGSMTFTLPASGPMTYVFAVYDSGTESRGGIYDVENETISFPVARSGLYELLGREAAIRDRAAMDDETAEAAYFLASLEFMPPDAQGLFRPDGTMTRNEAAAVIGRMFLATDPALQSEYSDVDLSDPAYAYISYGTASQIFTGMRDGTFRGEADITREELLTVLGRTLLYRRRQDAPAAEEPFGFDDEDALASYARGSVAALLESGILSPGGALRPKDLAARGEAAVWLYRMYCELYGYNGK